MIIYLPTVTWFQVFQSNTNYFKQSIWPIYGIITDTMTSGQRGPGSNDYKGVLHIPQSYRIGASPPDSV